MVAKERRTNPRARSTARARDHVRGRDRGLGRAAARVSHHRGALRRSRVVGRGRVHVRAVCGDGVAGEARHLPHVRRDAHHEDARAQHTRARQQADAARGGKPPPEAKRNNEVTRLGKQASVKNDERSRSATIPGRRRLSPVHLHGSNARSTDTTDTSSNVNTTTTTGVRWSDALLRWVRSHSPFRTADPAARNDPSTIGSIPTKTGTAGPFTEPPCGASARAFASSRLRQIGSTRTKR